MLIKADQLIIGEQRKSAKGCSTATIPPYKKKNLGGSK